MANHIQAKKRNRQRIKRTVVNKAFRSMVRTYVKRVRAAVDEGNVDTAREALTLASKSLDRAAGKGLYHRKTVSRTISRLTVAVNKIV